MTPKPFRDRREVGEVLFGRLQRYRDRDDVVVPALPCGGTPVVGAVPDSPQDTCEESSRVADDELADLQRPGLDVVCRDGMAGTGERFHDRQSARPVTAAEECYRGMFGGRVASRSLRDGHMLETLRDADKYPSKSSVCKHSSPTDHASATELGDGRTAESMFAGTDGRAVRDRSARRPDLRCPGATRTIGDQPPKGRCSLEVHSASMERHVAQKNSMPTRRSGGRARFGRGRAGRDIASGQTEAALQSPVLQVLPMRAPSARQAGHRTDQRGLSNHRAPYRAHYREVMT